MAADTNIVSIFCRFFSAFRLVEALLKQAKADQDLLRQWRKAVTRKAGGRHVQAFCHH